MFWRHLYLNTLVLVNGIYCDSDEKMFLNYKRKYCKPAAHFILDFSKLILRLLVKYTIKSIISNPVTFALSHLVLHSDSTHIIIHLQYLIFRLCKDTHWHSTEKQVCRGFITITSGTTSIYFWSFDLSLWSKYNQVKCICNFFSIQFFSGVISF